MRRTVVLPLLACSPFMTGCVPETDTDTDANKEVVRRFTELTNSANWEQLSNVVASDFKRHGAAAVGEPVTFLAQFMALQEQVRSDCPEQVRSLVE